MTDGEVLKVVFPLLDDGKDLASCMQVCKQWRDIARDDYFWKCLGAKRWPSICKRPTPPPYSYQKFFQMFSKSHHCTTLLPLRLSFDDLEFYIDIWAEESLVFSEMVPGSVFRGGIKNLPPAICEMQQFHLEVPKFEMIIPVEPKFSIPLTQTVIVSVLVGRTDTNMVAWILNKSLFFVDRRVCWAHALDYPAFSPVYPFISGIRARASLLLMEHWGDGLIEAFGIELDFCDAANSEGEVLCLLDMLYWK